MVWKRFMLNNGLHLAWIVAVTATLGSLYFSEILGYIPCNLCWYQRILMYPLAILLGIAAVRKDYGITVYVLPLTMIGGVISFYHYLYEKTDWLKESGGAFCGITPCDVEYINWFGFVTIPFLALVAFFLIAILCVLIRRADRTTY